MDALRSETDRCKFESSPLSKRSIITVLFAFAISWWSMSIADAMGDEQRATEKSRRPRIAALCVVSTDGKETKDLYQNPRARFLGSASWSRDGAYIAFDASFGDGHILVIPAIGGEAIDLGLGARPDWSPDRSRLVFWLPPWFQRSGAEAGVWVMNQDGKERLHICPGESPRWSPTRDEIAAPRNTESTGNLYIVDLVTNDERVLLSQDRARVLGATWSPNGEELAYMAKDSQGTIILAVVNRGGEAKGHRELRSGNFVTEFSLSYPSWSPDGKTILFAQFSREGQSVALMPITGGEPTVVSARDNGKQTDPTWSPDGKWILYATHRE